MRGRGAGNCRRLPRAGREGVSLGAQLLSKSEAEAGWNALLGGLQSLGFACVTRPDGGVRPLGRSAWARPRLRGLSLETESGLEAPRAALGVWKDGD